MRLATVAWCAALAAAGCGGIRVEATTWRPAREVSAPAPVRSVRIVPDADAVVTSLPDWRAEGLGDADWLMVGGRDDGEVWYALLRFDLSALEGVTSIESATLELPRRTEPPMPELGYESRYAVLHVIDPWEEATVSWIRAPRVAEEPVARVVSPAGTGALDVADLTEWVSRAHAAGAERVSIAVLPGRDHPYARRLWGSREALGADDEPEANAWAAPRLVVVAGEPPPRSSVAERARDR